MLLFVLACATKPTPEAPTPPAPVEPTPIAEVTPAKAPVKEETLAGQTVETTQDGVWTVRRVGSPSAGEFGGGEGASKGFSGLGMRGSGVGGGGSSGYGSGIATLGAPAAAPKAPPSTTAAPEVARQSKPQEALRAGSTDDNAAFDKYLKFLADWPEEKALSGGWQYLPVHDRRLVTLTDAAGRPVPGATVEITRADGKTEQLTTYGDGRSAVYAALAGRQLGEGACPCTVTARVAGAEAHASWDGAADLDLRLPTEWARPTAVPLDVAFVIDTTGSMSDEIARVQDTLLAVTKRVRALQGGVDLRYGAVLYRDVGDTYLTRLHPFTGDAEAFDTALREVRADGGGDEPESLDQGLATAVDELRWRPAAAKVAFLIADAAPHLDYAGDIPYGTSAWNALHQGIRVHTVAASGLGDTGSLVFRQIAQLTRGQFVFIEYGSIEASAADHGVTGPVDANNLDRILFDRIRAEVETYAAVAAR